MLRGVNELLVGMRDARFDGFNGEFAPPLGRCPQFRAQFERGPGGNTADDGHFDPIGQEFDAHVVQNWWHV